MKKVKLTIALLFLLRVLCSGQTYNPASKSFSNIAAMTAEKGVNGIVVKVNGFYNPGDGGGGLFRWNDTSTHARIVGLFEQGAGASVGRWERIIEGEINIRWLGAKGIGIPGITADTTAVFSAFKYLRERGGGTLYFPNTFTSDRKQSYYCFAGKSVPVGDNVKIHGDGKGKSVFRNVSPSTNGSFKGTIFLTSTYAGGDDNGPFQPSVQKFDIYPQDINDTVLVLHDITKADSMFVGEVIMYGCLFHFKNGVTSKPRFTYGELNEITRISHDSIFVRLPIRIPIFDDSTGKPGQILNINNNAGMSSSFGVPNGTYKNFELSDMTITQAQSNELADTALTKDLASIINPGGLFNFRFRNLIIDAYQAFGGNIMTWGQVQNVDFFSESRLMDLGYNSSRIDFDKIHYTFKESPASDFATSLLVLNDGPHDISIDGLICDGSTFRGANFMIGSNMRGFTFKNVLINYPDYNYNQVGFSLGADSLIPMQDIHFQNVEFNVDAIGQVFRISQSGDNRQDDDNITMKNIKFKGNLTANTGDTLFNFTFNTTDPPVRNDQYSTNGSTYAYRGKKPLKVSGTTYQAPFVRISGTSSPLSTGTLTRVFGSGASSITYTAVSTEASMDPLAFYSNYGRKHNYSDMYFSNGKMSLNRDSNMTMSNVILHDSLIITNSSNINAGIVTPTSNTVSLGSGLSIINNTAYINGSATSAPTVNTYTYTGTDTWNGTAPTGTPTKSLTVVRNGRIISLYITIAYTTPGATNTSVDLTWPSQAPLPLEVAPFNSSNDVMYKGVGQLGTGTSSANTNGGSFLIKTGFQTYKLNVGGNSVSGKELILKIDYPAASDVAP